MAVTVASLQAVLDMDKHPFERGLDSAESRFHKFGSIIKTGALAAGAAIGTGLAVAAKVGFDEFNEGQKVAAQTAAVLKSTGGAANVTAKQIDDLATSLMKKTGIDDEAIKSGENLLLTFRGIRNEAGKGNDIFDQTTKVVTDMTVALGEDFKSASIQVGKALQDPIRGITALRRVGVSFTTAQEDQIKALVESGKTMEAQKMILGELRTEFGGSAEAAGKTFAGQLNILKETFRNTAGEIVGHFVPILIQIAKVLLPLVTAALDFVAKLLTRFGQEASKQGGRVHHVFDVIWGFIKRNVVPIVLELKDIAIETFQRMRKVIEDNRPALERIADRLGKLFRFLGQILLPIIKLIFQEVLPRVLNAAIQIIDKVSGAIEKVIGWFRDAGDVAKNVFGHITGFVSSVRDTVQEVIDKVRSFFQTIHNGVDRVLGPLGKIKDVFGGIAGGISGAAGAVAGAFGGDGAIGAAAVGPSSISPTLFDDLALASAGGLVLTSGYRPGAITSTGNPSLHGVFPSKAIDVAGSESAMRRFFLFEAARGALTGLREVIHSPYWWHPGAGIQRIPFSAGSVLADHYSHVHVGSYDRGGNLMPGWNLAYNGLGRPEPVGAGTVINLNVGGSLVHERDMHSFIRRLQDEYDRRN